MNDLDLTRLKAELDSRGILMSFSGPFSHSIIEELGKVVKNYLESANVARSALVDVFAVYVEQAQNVSNYIRRKEQQPEHAVLLNSGIVVVAREGNAYVVSSGNLMLADDAPPLIARLGQLRDLDKAGLKALYKEQMRKPLTEAGGGGLGIIEMARKATAPLDYAFAPADGGYVFFSLKVAI